MRIETVYIGGNIASLSPDDAAKRFGTLEKLIKDLGVKVLSPLHAKDLYATYTHNELVHRDEHDIDASHILICKMDRPSIGSSMEIYRAREICNIPVILISTTDSVVGHPWILSKVSKIVESDKKAIEYLKLWYL